MIDSNIWCSRFSYRSSVIVLLVQSNTIIRWMYAATSACIWTQAFFAIVIYELWKAHFCFRCFSSTSPSQQIFVHRNNTMIKINDMVFHALKTQRLCTPFLFSFFSSRFEQRFFLLCFSSCQMNMTEFVCLLKQWATHGNHLCFLWSSIDGTSFVRCSCHAITCNSHVNFLQWNETMIQIRNGKELNLLLLFTSHYSWMHLIAENCYYFN